MKAATHPFDSRPIPSGSRLAGTLALPRRRQEAVQDCNQDHRPRRRAGAEPDIKVGTTDKLGLSSPLSATSDVLQWSKVSGSAWQIQTSALTVDVNHATVKPGAISAGDSFEFTYLTAG